MTAADADPLVERWEAVRRAYRAILGDDDPVAARVAAGATDARPGGPVDPGAGATDGHVVPGPDDLRELRRVVEAATGPGTWPAPPAVEGERHTVVRPVDRAGPVLALVRALEGIVEDRSGAWRTWPTLVSTLAPAVEALDELTFDAVVVRP